MRIISCLVLLVALTIPAEAWADGQVIVRYRTHASAGKRRSTIEAIGGAVIGAVRGQGTRVIAVAGDPAAAAARLAHKAGVQWAEPDAKLFALGTPDDPLLDQLGGLGLIHAQVA